MDHEQQLADAIAGFDLLFADKVQEARQAFSSNGDAPLQLLGLGVTSFLEAALGMEEKAMKEAVDILKQAEASAKKMQEVKPSKANTKLQNLEWDVAHADAVILNGMVNALGETMTGYMKCGLALNSAHSKFTKLYATVYPEGLDHYETPYYTSPRARSISQLSGQPERPPQGGLFSRFMSSTPPPAPAPAIVKPRIPLQPNGPTEELVMAGTAFGFGLFNLVLSLLPKSVQGVAVAFGYRGDRDVALKALAVSAKGRDVHSVFSGLILMTYYSYLLLLSGYQADRERVLQNYKTLVADVESRYPLGSLWVFNRAKILRFENDSEGAVDALLDALKPDRPYTFREADTLLTFEAAWTLQSLRRYTEAAEMFLKVIEVNNWSRGTYLYLIAGCYLSAGDKENAKKYFQQVLDAADSKKIGGKDLPTETLIKKKIQFYKAKQRRRGGEESLFVDVIKISPAEEMALFWNNHRRVGKATAIENIEVWSSLSPPVTIPSRYIPQREGAQAEGTLPDLDTPDELALRSLLLGVVHITAGEFVPARAFLEEAISFKPKIQTSQWIPPLAMFELATLDTVEAQAIEKGKGVDNLEVRQRWASTIVSANDKLDKVRKMSGSAIDMSSRLEGRVMMFKDELSLKELMLAQSSVEKVAELGGKH